MRGKLTCHWYKLMRIFILLHTCNSCLQMKYEIRHSMSALSFLSLCRNISLKVIYCNSKKFRPSLNAYSNMKEIHAKERVFSRTEFNV